MLHSLIQILEGRGFPYPYAVSENYETATRLGAKRSVQGCDCDVRMFETLIIDNKHYVPLDHLYLHAPIDEDIKKEREREEKNKETALFKTIAEKAKESLSKEEYEFLMSQINKK